MWQRGGSGRGGRLCVLCYVRARSRWWDTIRRVIETRRGVVPRHATAPRLLDGERGREGKDGKRVGRWSNFLGLTGQVKGW